MTDNDQSEPASDITVMRDEHSISQRDGDDPPRGDALVPRVLKNRFCLEDKLGSGGMGTVFKAKDLRKVEARDRNPFVAVKVLNNDFREHPEAFNALQREASKSQSLNHPNIVSIFDFDKDGETPFITMELLEGRELAELLRSFPTGLPEEMAWNVIEGICAGLAYAHDEGVIHADFKPGNVYVASSNHPKILDFGIARAVQINQAQGDDTVFDPASLAALTPAYASREMLNGDNPEVRDDLYSLGIVIYLVLTGHHPFGRSSAEEAFNEGLRPEKPKCLSRRQWRVLEKCLAFHRSGRPHSVGEVRHYLFDPAPWRTRPAFAVAAAFAFALALGTFYGDPKMSEVKAEALGVEPMARIVAYSSAGVDPAIMGIGPVPAIRKLLKKTELTLDDIDLIELNEAFAAQVLACQRELDLDLDRLNVNGGAIALGHPIGATGARVVVTLVHEMRRRKARRGIATLCISGGMGLALLVEAL